MNGPPALLPLERPPSLLQLGFGTHGQRRFEEYRLPGLWCLHLYPYRARLTLDGDAFDIVPGSVSLTPPDTRMEYEYFEVGTHLYAIFTLPETEPRLAVPRMREWGEEFEPLWERLADAAGIFPVRPARATAAFWETLWRIAETTEEDSGATGERIHPAVAAALRAIERDLAGPLRVADLAREADVSQNTLSRRFREATGRTVEAFIRERRIQRATHQLRYSTLPIKEIAAQVGLPDLHQFNKTFRRETGMAPSRWRG